MTDLIGTCGKFVEPPAAVAVADVPCGREAVVVAEASAALAEAPLERKVYDVTDVCVQLCTVLGCPLTVLILCAAPLGQKTLVLEEEEAVLDEEGCFCCCPTVTRMPYGELKQVKKSHSCGCVRMEIFRDGHEIPVGITPGCCCENVLVDEVVHELNLRKMGKSKEELQAREIERLHARIDALMANVPMTSVDKPMEISR